MNGRDDRYVELKAILGQYFVDRNQLDRLLSDHLNTALSTIDAPSDNLPDTIHKIVMWADSRGVVCRLAVAAIKERPARSELRSWCDTRCPFRACHNSRGSGLTIRQQVLEGPVFFDLDELRRKVRATLNRQRSGVVGFGIPYEDDSFVNALAKWFDIMVLARAQIMDPINLDPIFPKAEPQAREVSGYRRQLDRGDVLLRVRVSNATAAMSDEFLRAVRAAYPDLTRHHLVLIFTAGSREPFPDGIELLPRPRFDQSDINDWAWELIRWFRDKPDWEPDAITAEIVETARVNDALDVRLVYFKMSAVIAEISEDPETYLAHLKGRRRPWNPGTPSTPLPGSAATPRCR